MIAFNSKLYIPIIITSILIIIIVFIIIYNQKKDNNESLFNTKSFLVEEFFEFRKEIYNNYDKKSLDFKGVYIIYNKNKDKYYIGQSIDVIDRINMHFTGKGNGDVYADYKNKDIFIIRYVLLSSTNYNDLNKLEKSLIMAYHAKDKGYNKTKGNK